MSKQSCRSLRLLLGDQLLEDAAIIKNASQQSDVFLMCEVLEEMTYVTHHPKKVVFILSAMRHFAERLREQGFRVHYVKFDEQSNPNSLVGELERAIALFEPEQVLFTFPGEYRVWSALKTYLQKRAKPWQVLADEKFLTQPKEFRHWAEGHKQLVMEYFYRQLRKKFNILMEGNTPCGGHWNYDKDNRKKPPKRYSPPPPCAFVPDEITQDLVSSLSKRLSAHPGTINNFSYGVTRQDALKALHFFIEHNLATFGDYQDAMLNDEPWMSHSHLSLYINVGLLRPQECIEAVERAYVEGKVKINNAEGYIRQLLGWREYVRGLYWHAMPAYKNNNALEAKRPLPSWFWNAKTKMNCLHQSIGQTLDHAYAHHIQRLMVIGNFCLLMGFAPKEVSDWYLAVYIDAFEWVELPNVLGMILYADKGLLASKPYAASGNYINKMSNYCQNCIYDVKQKVGERACPYNYLYWHFIDQHQEQFSRNPRMSLILKNWQTQDQDLKNEIAKSAEQFAKTIEQA